MGKKNKQKKLDNKKDRSENRGCIGEIIYGIFEIIGDILDDVLG